MSTRREFLSTVGAGALTAWHVVTARKAHAASLIDVYPALEQQLRSQADRLARELPPGGELRLESRTAAFAATLARPEVTRAARDQVIPPDGLLTFAVDVAEPTYVAAILELTPDADLRPGLRASVLSDRTLVGAPMTSAAEWGTKEVTDPAPRVRSARPSRTVAIPEWLLSKGRHYLTVAGPHFRPAGRFHALTLRTRPRRVESPTLTFAFISDTHVYAEAKRLDWMNRKMGDRTADEFARTVDALAAEEIDFVLHGGDMTETAVRPEFQQFAQLLKNRSLPVYGCMGNHDVYLPSSRPDALELLGDHFPGGTLDYTFSKAPLRFVVLDVEIEKPEMQARKQEWLWNTLAADKLTPTIFAWHYAPYNRAGVSSCGFRMFDWSALGRKALLDILHRSPNVFATLNGHDHWDEVSRLAGVVHIQNAAFVEWPNTYRVIRVYADRIEWEVRQVANRGYVRESFLPEKGLSWMIATREGDLTGSAPFTRAGG